MRHKRKETPPRRSTKTEPAAPVPPRSSKPTESSREELHVEVAKRAFELYCERGQRHGHALDDWLEAEREILSRTPP